MGATGRMVPLATACLLTVAVACGGDETSTDPTTDVTTAVATGDSTTADPTSTAAATTSSAEAPTTAAATTTTTTSTIPPTTQPPPSTTTAPTTMPATTSPAPSQCGTGPVPPMPGGAVEVTSVTLDAIGDGTADDTATTYFDPGASQWRLRMELPSGPTDDLEVTGVGAGFVRVLGPTQIGSTDGTGQEELLAVVGSGASTMNVGAFGTDDTGCLFRFTLDDGTPFVAPIGGTVTRIDGLRCAQTSVEVRSAVETSAGLWEVTSEMLGRDFTVLYVTASTTDVDVATADLGDLATLDCPGMTL